MTLGEQCAVLVANCALGKQCSVTMGRQGRLGDAAQCDIDLDGKLIVQKCIIAAVRSVSNFQKRPAFFATSFLQLNPV
jgi:hypothetical protein